MIAVVMRAIMRERPNEVKSDFGFWILDLLFEAARE
jgi:hypothetical protein